MVRNNFSKRSHPPRRPFDKDRLIDEMKLVGMFGLKNKRELWTVQKMCDKVKHKALNLLITSNEREQIVHGRNIIDNLVRRGILPVVDLQSKSELHDALNSVLNLTASDFLKRRLQHVVYELGIADNVHHARGLIVQKQISVKGEVVNCPGYEVSKDNEAYVEIYAHSAKAGAKKGRNKRKETVEDGYENNEE